MELFLTDMQLLKTLTDGLLWCFYQLFGLILTAPIHCRVFTGEQLMQCHIFQNLMMKQTFIYILDGLRTITFLENWLNFAVKLIFFPKMIIVIYYLVYWFS